MQNFYQDDKRAAGPSKSSNVVDADPNQHLYLAAALGSLGLKNERTNNANGNIVEMLEPNVHLVIKQIAKEKELNRKLDNSAVMPVDMQALALADGVNRISSIVAQRGIVNNSKPKPEVQNEFYQALTKSKQTSVSNGRTLKNNEPNVSALGVKSLDLSDLKAVNTNSHDKAMEKQIRDDYQILNSANKANLTGGKGEYDNMFDPKIMSTQLQSSQQDPVPYMSEDKLLDDPSGNKSRQSSCLENSIIKSNREKKT